MEIKESDRNALRKNQRRINPNVIGNIIEYKPQNPKTYKKPETSSGPSKDLPSKEPSTESIVKSPITNGKTNGFQTNGNCKDKTEPVAKPIIETTTTTKTPAPDDLNKLPITPEEVKKNNWLNMDKVEFDKMAWMFDPPKMIDQENSTKFDRNGMVVSKLKETNHQSDEKDATISIPELDLDSNDEAFDIGQLAMLLDSGYQRQVSYALVVVRNIAQLANEGYYDGVFSENIQSLLIKYYLLRVRHQMDNKDQTTRFTAFRCLAAMICNTDIDEYYLNRIYTTICDSYEYHMRLRIKNGSQYDGKGGKLTDMQYAEVNPIMCLIERTNILQRFAYIMGDKTIPYYDDYLECIVDVLVRFSRHSLEVCLLLNRKDLLQILVDSCLLNISQLECDYTRRLCLKTLKLFRLIAEAILEAAEMKKIKRSQKEFPEAMVSRIQGYFLINYEKISYEDRDILIQLKTESIRIVKVLSQLGNFEAQMMDLMILSQGHLFEEMKYLCALDSTEKMSPPVSINWQLAAHLIDLCGSFRMRLSHHGKMRFFTDLLDNYIRNSFYKWLNDVINAKMIPHLDVSISIVTAFKYFNALDPSDKIIEKLIIEFTSISYNTQFFQLLLRTCNEMSLLRRFTEINGQLRDAPCLPSYGVLKFNRTNEHKSSVNPIVDSYGPFLLLDMFITKLAESSDVSKIAFINDLTFTRYVKDATSYDHLPVTYEEAVKRSFLAQQEVKLLAKILLLLNRYYNDNMDPQSCLILLPNTIDLREPEKFQKLRKDCYSNICYNTVALLGLLNSRPELDRAAYKLKSKLLEKVLFSDKFQFRFSRENSRLKTKNEESDLNSWQNCIIKGKSGEKLVYELDFYTNRALFSLYETLPFTNRYWILEPLLQYYKIQTCYQKDAKIKDDYWFKNNFDWTTPTGELITCTDAKIITVALEFHLMVLLYCRAYKQTIVRSNLEEFLTVLGSLFLHDDIFLDEKLNTVITNNIGVIMNDCLLKPDGKFQIPFKSSKKRIESLNLTLGDFFDKLLQQYEAVSYGDHAFSNYLLLFITPESDPIYRKKLFQEKADVCLPLIRVQAEDLFCPKGVFFTITEKDQEMKTILKKAKRYSQRNNLLMEYIEFHSS